MTNTWPKNKNRDKNVPYKNSIKNALKSMTLVPVANKTPVEHELLTLLENLSSTHILDDVNISSVTRWQSYIYSLHNNL
jgi:hypothetical protein